MDCSSRKISTELKQVWHKLNSVPANKRKLQGKLLDIFLAKLIHTYRDVPCSVHLTEWASVGNLLAHQLLSDVTQACGDGDASTVCQYLRHGRGWKLLWALMRIGVEVLPCSRELARVMVSMLSFCVKWEQPAERGFISKLELPALDQCASTSRLCPATYHEMEPRRRKIRRPVSHQTPVASRSSSSSSASDSDERQSSIPSAAVKTSILFLLPFKLAEPSAEILESATEGDDWQQWVQFDEDEGLKCLLPNIPMTEGEKEVQDANISQAFLVRCILEVVYQVCWSELRGDHCSPATVVVSTSALPSVLDLFTSLCLTSEAASSFQATSDVEGLAGISRAALRLLIVSASALLASGRGYEESTIKDVRLICNLLDAARVQNKLGENVLASESVLAVLLLVRNIVCCFPARNGDIRLLVDTVQTMCSSDITGLVGSILAAHSANVHSAFKALTDTVLALKKVRAVYENRKSCHVAPHHHSDLLGSVGRHSIKNPVPRCCVAAVCQVLLRVGRAVEVQDVTVQALDRCGLCCCLLPDDICATLLRQFEQLTEEVRTDTLRLLEDCIFKPLCCRGSASHCAVCNGSKISAPITMSSYCRLIMAEESAVAQQVRAHLLRVIRMATGHFKALLYSEAVLPSFLASFSSGRGEGNEDSEFTLPNFALAALSTSGPAIIEEFASEPQHIELLLKFVGNHDMIACRHLAIGLLEAIMSSKSRKENEAEDVEPLCTFISFLTEKTRSYQCIMKMKSVESLCVESHPQSLPPFANEKSAELSVLCDLWSACKRMARMKAVRRCLTEGRCAEEGYFLLMHLVDELIASEEPSRTLFASLDALLALFLGLCPVRLWEGEQCLTHSDLVRELRNRLYCYTGKTTRDKRLLLDVILKNLVHWTYHKVPSPSTTEKQHENTSHQSKERDQSLSSLDIEVPCSRNDSGYEADLEFGAEGSRPSSGDVFSKQMDSSVICYEDMCGLVLDLLCQLYSLHDDMQSHVLALHVIRRLEALCSQHSLVLAVFYRENAIKKLCHAFTSLLSFPESHVKELQENLINLLVMLCKHKTSSDDLSSYIQLFKGPKPAFGILLRGLITLVGLAEEGPQCCLRFPIAVTDELSTDSDDEIVVLPSCSNSLLPQEMCKEFPWHLRTERERGREDAWAAAAGVLPLIPDGSWSPLREGFSMGFWLRLRPPPNYSSSLLHLASVGSEGLLLEAWVIPLHGSMVIHVTRCTNFSRCRVAEHTFPNILPLGSWHHVGLSYREASSRSPYRAQVTVVVDGHRVFSCCLCSEMGEDVCNHPSFMLLGHGCASSGGSLELGNLFFFRACFLTVPQSFALFAEGPDQCSLTECAFMSQGYPAISNLTPELLCTELDFSLLSGNCKEPLNILQEKLYASYSPLTSDIFVIYPQAVAAGGFSSAILNTFRAAQDDQRTSQQQPVTREVVQLETLRVMCKHQFHQALGNLGGVSVFLFLFARVVECSEEEESQALALEALFTLLRQHPAHRAHFQEMDGLALLAHVFRSARWLASPCALQVAVNACLSGPLLEYDASMPSKLRVALAASDTGEDVLLVWPQLLCTLVGHWATGLGWTTLLRVTWALVRDRHPHRNFNLHHGAPLFHCLLTRLKEILLEDEKWGLDKDSVVLIVHILEAFVHDPLRPNEVPARLSACFDLVLLLHEMSEAYVSHARSAFYFLPPSHCLSDGSSATRSWSPACYVHSNVSSPCSSDYEVKCNPNGKSGGQKDSQGLQGNPEVVDTGLLAQSTLGCIENGISITDKNLEAVYGPRGSEMPSSRLPPDNQKSQNDLSWSTSHSISSLPVATIPKFAAITTEHGMQPGQCLFSDSIIGKHRATPAEDTLPWEEQLQSGESAKDGVVMLVQGLLRLTCNVLLVSPKPMVCQKLDPILRPEALIVLAHNSSPVVRNEILCVLDAYLSKASQEMLNSFLRVKGFQLLGAQLGRHPASEALVRSCCELFLGCRVSFDRPVALKAVPEHPIRRAATVLVLSVLPQTSHDPKLCCATLRLLRQICNTVDGAARVLYNNGVGESLACLIASLPRAGSSGSEIVEGILDLLQVIVLQTCRFAIQNTKKLTLECFHTFVDLLAAQLSAHSVKCNAGCVPIFRDCQLALYSAMLELLQSFHRDTHRSTGWPLSIAEGFATLGPLSDDFSSFPSSELLFNSSLGSAQSRSHSVSPSAAETSPILHQSPPPTALARELHNVFVQACELVVYNDASSARSPLELSLASNLVKMAVAGASLKTPKLGQLCCCLLAPNQELAVRLRVAQELSSSRGSYEAFFSLLHSKNKTVGLLLGFAYELLSEHVSEMCPEECTAVEDLIALLTKCSPTGSLSSPHTRRLSTAELENQWKTKWMQERETWLARQKSAISRVASRVRKLESKASKASVEATRMTRAVVELLNALHKEFVWDTKARYGRDVVIKQAWCRLATTLTHERAVWHFPECFPKAWELDPTEGPSRIRRRLRRCPLHIDPKFLLPEFQSHIGPNQAMPLQFLYTSEYTEMHSAAFLHHLHVREKITYTNKCKKIFPCVEMPGEVLLGQTAMQFVPDFLGIQKGHLGEVHAVHEVWNYEDIKEILLRRYQLQDNALEVFLHTGVTVLLAFTTTLDRNELCSHLKVQPQVLVTPSDSLEGITQSWQERRLTNFDYLTMLNKLAGRSFNDLMQYPVFPFVLAQYDAHLLDLSSPSTFRALSRPMAVQDKKWEAHFMSHFKAELSPKDRMLPFLGPCHYRSHYSNSGTVLHFLVRLPPYTQMFLTYQDNSFDQPDRTFHSLHTTWRLTSSESTTDVKELIPEFFFLPEFLINGNGFDFGVRQNGERVADVNLPPWCRRDPRLFVLVHRQALESAIVTEQLGHWIDLVFGFKQTGKAAEEAINVFHPATYYGVDISMVLDPITEQALQTMIRTYGQMPKQLFHSPHPLVHFSVHGASKEPTQQVVMPEVKGLQWGYFVGSPANPEPRLATRLTGNPVGSLVALLTNDVWGLHPNTCLIPTYSHEKAGSSIGGTYIVSTALISWGHPDNIVRAKLKKDHSAMPLLHSPAFDSVCICSSSPDCKLLFIGYSSGLVAAYSLHITASKVERMCPPVSLLAHKEPVTGVYICKAFGIVATASRDGSCIVWDLNRLSYVRTIEQGRNPIQHICVSSTLGDVAAVEVVENTGQSILRVNTINGTAVGHIESGVQITSLCYSSAPEGTSVNVIAAGLKDGSISLWSSWDLSLVRNIKCDWSLLPLISLTYSQDNDYLYAADSEGTVFVWESQARNGAKFPRFHLLH